MKFKNLLVLFFITITAISCKDEAKNQEGSATADTFKFEITLVAKKDDNFCMLYTKDGSLNFIDGVWKEVKGSETEQTLEFSLPSGVFPTQLRLDLGKNQTEGVVVKTIKFENSDKIREIKGKDIEVFFRADASKCTFDSSTGIVKALDGKNELSLYPNESILKAELPKLAK